MTRAAPDVSAELASLSDDELTTLIESAPGRPGWGVTRSVEVAGHRVFVKTIPVTDAELGADDPTADVFDLPLAYRYGIGSAGVSAHRELMAHQITTRWVSERLCAGFPLLYHHRLLPLPGQTRIFERLDRYVAYWGGSPEIRSFIEARQGSSYAIALFCEHLPHTLMDWLPENQERIGHVLDRALEITDFLRTRGAVHADLHSANVLTDGERLCLADFGLFLHPRFAMSEAERDFLDQHQYFDIAEFVGTLTQTPPDREFVTTPEFDDAIAPFVPLGRMATDLFDRLKTDPTSTGLWDDTEARRLLEQARR